MANIKSKVKRIKTNEKARQRHQSVRSQLRTSVRRFNEAVAAQDKDAAVTTLAIASRDLDKAVSKGTIHKNQAANRKSAMATKANAL